MVQILHVHVIVNQRNGLLVFESLLHFATFHLKIKYQWFLHYKFKLLIFLRYVINYELWCGCQNVRRFGGEIGIAYVDGSDPQDTTIPPPLKQSLIKSKQAWSPCVNTRPAPSVSNGRSKTQNSQPGDTVPINADIYYKPKTLLPFSKSLRFRVPTVSELE